MTKFLPHAGSCFSHSFSLEYAQFNSVKRGLSVIPSEMLAELYIVARMYVVQKKTDSPKATIVVGYQSYNGGLLLFRVEHTMYCHLFATAGNFLRGILFYAKMRLIISRY